VDEVLAVGDGEFQRKCLGKMREVAGRGRAVVCVSHNLNVIQRLCNRAVLISDGQLQFDGSPDRTITHYLETTSPELWGGSSVISDEAERVGTGEARVREVGMRDLSGAPVKSIHIGQPFRVVIGFEAFEDLEDIAFEVGVSTLEGDQVLAAQSIDGDRPATNVPKGVHEVSVEIDAALLPHEFVLEVGMHRMSGVTVDYVLRAYAFGVLNSNEQGGDEYHWSTVRGYVRPSSTWSELSAPVDPTPVGPRE
jgi:lipopolysaccharide transport system ATP-binding protein